MEKHTLNVEFVKTVQFDLEKYHLTFWHIAKTGKDCLFFSKIIKMLILFFAQQKCVKTSGIRTAKQSPVKIVESLTRAFL